jgi:dTDP-4-dehydrorhamnose 3,5-epimerase-like enzyme
MITVHDCQILDLPGSCGADNSPTAARSDENLPFEIARVYYLYDVADGQKRGGHAHKKLQQLIIPIVGSFDLLIDDGRKKRALVMDRPDRGLHIPGHIWTEVVNFSPGAVCMVLASLAYDEEEYIRDYDQFLQFKNVAEQPNDGHLERVW